ncbi:Prenyltransferase and squalene oxidase repeat [Popillia japonica]|uniref:Geranylgeranyl transferase type-1 subunit beta n=1 Tax=Popillia japonica TaxID=7064 RepID=A0AAW1MUR7_POPJA
MPVNLILKPKLHKKYLYRCLQCIPSHFASYDTTRLVLAFFAISGLDLLKDLNNLKKQQKIIDWIYSLQVVDDKELVSGFQGSTTLNTIENRNQTAPYKWCHIAGTYTALWDDLSRVNKEAIARSLKVLQLPNGVFCASLKVLQLPNGVFCASKDGSESDMRFIYCAACISYIIDDWSGVNIEKATDYILKSLTYEFGFAQAPQLEAHGGSTYCAIASLALMGKLSALTETQRKHIIRWLLNRQKDGFQGRPNKPVDTCYSFWVGAALKILDVFDFVDFDQNKTYVLSTQDNLYGGLSKWVDTTSDPLHTYMGLSGLSLMKYDELEEIHFRRNTIDLSIRF